MTTCCFHCKQIHNNSNHDNIAILINCNQKFPSEYAMHSLKKQLNKLTQHSHFTIRSVTQLFQALQERINYQLFLIGEQENKSRW